MENKELFKEIADWITETGLEHTSNGSYILYYENIAEEFNVSEEWVKEHDEDIEYCLDFDIVADCCVDDECFDMMFYLQYCCEHCQRYLDGNRSYDNCGGSCDCWCDSMDDEDE